MRRFTWEEKAESDAKEIEVGRYLEEGLMNPAVVLRERVESNFMRKSVTSIQPNSRQTHGVDRND